MAERTYEIPPDAFRQLGDEAYDFLTKIVRDVYGPPGEASGRIDGRNIDRNATFLDSEDTEIAQVGDRAIQVKVRQQSIDAKTLQGRAADEFVWSLNGLQKLVTLVAGTGISIVTGSSSILVENTGAAGTLALDDLSDVNAASPGANQIIKWNGSEWALASDATGGGGGTPTIVEKVTASGTTATLSQTPSSDPIVTVPAANIVLDKVASSPGPNEFSYSGTTVTLNAARSGAVLQVAYQYAASGCVIEALNPGGYPTSSGSLSEAPSSVDACIFFHTDANIALDRVASGPGPNEYTLTAGGAYVLGRTLTADGQAYAIFNT